MTPTYPGPLYQRMMGVNPAMGAALPVAQQMWQGRQIPQTPARAYADLKQGSGYSHAGMTPGMHTLSPELVGPAGGQAGGQTSGIQDVVQPNLPPEPGLPQLRGWGAAIGAGQAAVPVAQRIYAHSGGGRPGFQGLMGDVSAGAGALQTASQISPTVAGALGPVAGALGPVGAAASIASGTKGARDFFQSARDVRSDKRLGRLKGAARTTAKEMGQKQFEEGIQGNIKSLAEQGAGAGMAVGGPVGAAVGYAAGTGAGIYGAWKGAGWREAGKAVAKLAANTAMYNVPLYGQIKMGLDMGGKKRHGFAGKMQKWLDV